MKRFEEAFRKGLSNATVAEQNLEEIRGVIKAASDEIAETTKNAISGIEIEQRERIVQDPNVHIINFSRPYPGKKIKFNGLVAKRNGPEQKSALICEIVIDTIGYPVRLRYANRDTMCADKQAFENGLTEVLEHPTTGEAIGKLLKA